MPRQGVSLLGVFSRKKPKQRLSVEVGADWLKWAYAAFTADAGWTVADAGAIRSTDPAALSQAFSAVCKKYKILPGEVTGCIPRHQVTTRNLELPSVDPHEIKKIVDLQAAKQTPYAPEEIVYDYYLLKSFREGYSSVMLVIVHRDTLNTSLRFIREMGLKAHSLSLASLGSASWTVGHARAGSGDDIIAVLDVDASHTDFFIRQGSLVLFTQTLSIGADRMISDPAEWIDKFTAELSRFMQIYRSEEIAREPQELALGGASEILQSQSGRLAGATGLKVTELPKPEWPKGAAHPNLSFTAVLGLASSEKTIPINLVPQEILLQDSLVEKSRHLLTTGILILALALLVVTGFVARYNRRLGYLRWLERQSSTLSSGADEVAYKRGRIKKILQIHDASTGFFDVFLRTLKSAPREIYLTEINWTRENHLILQGRADTMTAVFDYVNEMKKIDGLGAVESKRLTKRIAGDREVVDFEIDSVIRPPKPRAV